MTKLDPAPLETSPVSERIFKGFGIELRPVTPRDLPDLRRWRNSPKIRDQMRDRSHISSHQQRLWYERLKDRRDEAHWVVWFEGVRTGYLNIKGKGPLPGLPSVNVGMYVGDSRVRRGLLGYAMALMQMKIVFEELKVPEIHMTVKQTNVSAIQFNQHLGYRQKGLFEGYVVFVMTRAGYDAAKSRLARYFSC